MGGISCLGHLHACVTNSVYYDVLQKSIPAQIRQLILCYSVTNKDKLTDVCGDELMHNDCIKLSARKMSRDESHAALAFAPRCSISSIHNEQSDRELHILVASPEKKRVLACGHAGRDLEPSLVALSVRSDFTCSMDILLLV